MIVFKLALTIDGNVPHLDITLEKPDTAPAPASTTPIPIVINKKADYSDIAGPGPHKTKE